MMRSSCHTWGAVVTLVSLFLFVGCGTEKMSIPETAKLPVTNSYHGIDVVDDYQWLEDSSDTKVKEWDIAQNKYARSVLDAIPAREGIEKELRRLYDHSSSQYYSFASVAGKLYAKKMQPPNDQAILVQLDSPTDTTTERVVVNPNKIDTTGKTSIDWYVVSPDGSLVAVSLSQGGTEDGHVSVYEVATGKALDDHVPHVNGPTAGGDVAWMPDNSGFYYTRYPREGERPQKDLRFYQQVFWHKLGTPTEEDTYALGEQFPRIAEIDFETSPDGSRILAVVSDGDGGEYYHWLRQTNGKWAQVTEFKDGISSAKFQEDNSLLLLSSKDADLGKILRLAPGETNLKKAGTLVDEGDAVIRSFQRRQEGGFPRGSADTRGIVRLLPDTTRRQRCSISQLLLPRAKRLLCLQERRGECYQDRHDGPYGGRLLERGSRTRCNQQQRRDADSVDDSEAQGAEAGRKQSHDSLWLRRIRYQPDAEIQRISKYVAESRRRVCDRQLAWRRRVR